MNDTNNNKMLNTEEAVKAQRALEIKYRKLFNSKDGKLILQDLKKAAGYGKPSFIYNDGYDPIQAALNDGGKKLLAYILKKLDK